MTKKLAAVTLDLVRLPELLEEEDGCEFAPACIGCWLPVCKWDMTAGERRSWRHHGRDEAIKALAREGFPRKDLAQRFGLSERHIRHILQEEEL